MRLTLLLILVLSQHLAAQSDLSSYEWKHFYPFFPAEDVVETADATWWVTQNYLVSYDHSSQELQIGGQGFPASELRNNLQLWADAEDQLHVYDPTGLAVYQDDTWTYQAMPEGFSLYPLDKLLYRDEAGAYYFLGGFFDVFQWTPGLPPDPAYAINAAAPWPIAEASWDPIANQLWITDRYSLGFVKDGVFTAVPLPASAGTIRYLHTAPNGALWVQLNDRILLHTASAWLSYLFPAVLQNELVQVSVNRQNQALLTSTATSLFLELQDGAIQATDWTVALSKKATTAPLLLDPQGKVWWLDTNEQAIGTYTSAGSIQWKKPSNWLPTPAEITFMTTDPEGRTWLTAGHKTHFYSDRSWWDASTLFPNFPDSARQILFTDDDSPIVFTSSEDFANFSTDNRIHWYRNGEWVVLSSPEQQAGAPPFLIKNLHLDRNGFLWANDFFGTSFAVLVAGEWEYIVPGNLFPTPSELTDIVLDQNNQQYIAANNGLFIRWGQSYQHRTYETLGASGGFGNGNRSIGISPEESIWITASTKVLKVNKNGRGVRVPLADRNGVPLPGFIISDIAPFADDDVWITYFFEGLAHFDGQAWVRFNADNSGLRSNRVNFVAQDQQKRVWFGTPEGISVLTPPERKVIFSRQRATAEMRIMPNPACCHAQLSWQQTEQERVQIWLADVQGRQLRPILDEILLPGPQSQMIHRNDLPAGVYFIVRQTESSLETQMVYWK